MSEGVSSEAGPQQSAKPGTACLGCRRRKLRCSREQEGCRNCVKADLPCVYPVAPETGIKRKRGPYKKDKAPRERHLEDLVRYLEPRTPANQAGGLSSSLDDQRAGAGLTDAEGSPQTSAGDTPQSNDGLPRHNSHSDDLVKDALIALTKSSVAEREHTTDSGARSTYRQTSGSATTVGPRNLHPPVRYILEHWQLFNARVDPLTKIIHCPTVAKRLFGAIDHLDAVEPTTETLLYSIYYASVSTCTANETRRRFGESRDVLLQRFGREVETTLANNYGMPVLESLQALVIYIICLRRQDDAGNVRTLFGLAVRMAQLIGLHEDPREAFSPFESEYRRRVWWHLCMLESRGAEEGGTRSTSIMQDRKVHFPANLNDHDLDPKATQIPLPRSGITDSTFPRARFDILTLVRDIALIRLEHRSDKSNALLEKAKAAQNHAYSEASTRLHAEYMKHFHPSRPYDWMCSKMLNSMLVKARMMIDHPFGQTPSKDMTPEERFRLLCSSVAIISDSHDLAVGPQIEGWHWFFRGYVQWHSLGIVVAELGRSTNRQFTQSAWAVLDPILADWDKTYQKRKDEPAWDHVNALIERAKGMRLQNAKRPVQVSHRPKSDAASRPSHKLPRTDSASTEPMPTLPTYVMPQPAFSQTSPPMQASPPDYASPQVPTPRSVDSGLSGNNLMYPTYTTPPMMGFDGDFNNFDNLEDIDFSAFDAVFGGSCWEFPSPLAEFNMEVG